MKQLDLLRALAADCRDQGEADIADGIDVLVADIEELVAAIQVERAALSSGDSVSYMEARLRTTYTLVKFPPVQAVVTVCAQHGCTQTDGKPCAFPACPQRGAQE